MKWLRSSGPATSPSFLAVNKVDTDSKADGAHEFHELGLGEPFPISGYHNLGLDDMMAEVLSSFPPEPEFPEPEADLRLAIVGRPNVGKSQLLNALTGENRSIVSDVPGTTRDTIDTLINYRDMDILLIDTAGIRRRGKIGTGIEKYSVIRSVRAIDRADVVILLMDAMEPATAQDTHIAGYILDSYKGFVLGVNKWDLLEGTGVTKGEIEALLRQRFKFATYAPVRFMSALEGNGLEDLLDTSLHVFGEWTKDIPRYDLRRTVMGAVAEHPPSGIRGRSLKIYSVAQDETAPPRFTFFVNRADSVHFSYERYLENRIRQGLRLQRQSSQDAVPGKEADTDMIDYLILVPLAYLLGSVPFGLIAGRLVANVDVRDYGSGKIGMTNVLRTSGQDGRGCSPAPGHGQGRAGRSHRALVLRFAGRRSRRRACRTVRTQLARLHQIQGRSRHRIRLGRTADPVANRRTHRHTNRAWAGGSDPIRVARLE